MYAIATPLSEIFFSVPRAEPLHHSAGKREVTCLIDMDEKPIHTVFQVSTSGALVAGVRGRDASARGVQKNASNQGQLPQSGKALSAVEGQRKA